MATLLEKITAQVSPSLPGVDWEALEQQFGMSREAVVYHSDPGKTPEETGAFAYDKYIDAARARAELQIDQILMSFQVKDDPNTSASEVQLAMTAWDEAQREAVKIGDVVLRALRMGKSLLTKDDTFVVNREAYRAIISATYLICLYGNLVHSRKLMQFEDFPPEEIVQSAENLTQMFNGLAMLGEMGAFGVLKPSATGASAPAIITVAIASVLAVGILCFAFVTMQETADFNRNVTLVCQDAIRRGDAKALERCEELTRLNRIGRDGGPVGEAAKSIADAAKWLAVLVGAVYILPKVMGAFPSKKDRKAFS